MKSIVVVSFFLKYFGGVNKGRPNDCDLALAEEFARGLREISS